MYYFKDMGTNSLYQSIPDSKIHGVNVGPTWGRQDPGGPHVCHTNLAIWDMTKHNAMRNYWKQLHNENAYDINHEMDLKYLENHRHFLLEQNS